MKTAVLWCALGVALVASAPSVAPVFGRVPEAQQTSALGGVTVVKQPGSVIGTAWRHDNSPVVHGLLRLRNVVTGRIVAGSQSDATGRFSFSMVAAGSYIVELVDDAGSIRAVGQMFSVGPGDTVATFIRLPGRAAWFDGFFTNAAAAALASAASLGVTAVGDGGQPASARF
jgi:hypothetical protein